MTTVREEDGTERQVAMAYMGGERSYEDYVYLQMLEREWKRPITDDDKFLDIAASHRPSARAIVVLVFWTYFETRIERLIREATRALPEAVVKDLLSRYTTVGSRMDRLYKVLFGSSYAGDLRALGYSGIADLLQRVQTQRNEFAHGHPEAIGDGLVEEMVAALKDEHESWIAVFNAKIKQASVRLPKS